MQAGILQILHFRVIISLYLGHDIYELGGVKMNFNWIKQTVSAVAGGGTGTFTLSTAESPYMTYGDALGGDRYVPYVAYESGVGFEEGWGQYTHSGTTLTRGEVRKTWNGTTFIYNGASALTFTTAAVISCPITSDSVMPAPMGRDDDNRTLSAGFPANHGGKTLTLVADRQYCAEFILHETKQLSNMGVYISTGVDASTTTIGISQIVKGVSLSSYLATATPATTTAQNSTVSMASVTAVTLFPGHYALHIVTDATGLVIAGSNADNEVIFSTFANSNTTSRANPAMCLSKNAVSVDGTLDADPSTVTAANLLLRPPKIYLDLS